MKLSNKFQTLFLQQSKPNLIIRTQHFDFTQNFKINKNFQQRQHFNVKLNILRPKFNFLSQRKFSHLLLPFPPSPFSLLPPKVELDLFSKKKGEDEKLTQQEIMEELLQQEEERIKKEEEETKEEDFDKDKKKFVNKTSIFVKTLIGSSVALTFYLNGFYYQEVAIDTYSGLLGLVMGLLSYDYGNKLAPRVRIPLNNNANDNSNSNLNLATNADFDLKTDLNSANRNKDYQIGVIFQSIGNFVFLNIASYCFGYIPFLFPAMMIGVSYFTIIRIPKIAGVMYDGGFSSEFLSACSIYHHNFMPRVFTYSIFLAAILLGYLLLFDPEEEELLQYADRVSNQLKEDKLHHQKVVESNERVSMDYQDEGDKTKPFLIVDDNNNNIINDISNDISKDNSNVNSHSPSHSNVVSN